MPRGASFLNPALGRAAWMWAALPSVCALSTLPTGMELTGDGHWQVGLEGTSLRGQTARGLQMGGPLHRYGSAHGPRQASLQRLCSH